QSMQQVELHAGELHLDIVTPDPASHRVERDILHRYHGLTVSNRSSSARRNAATGPSGPDRPGSASAAADSQRFHNSEAAHRAPRESPGDEVVGQQGGRGGIDDDPVATRDSRQAG